MHQKSLQKKRALKRNVLLNRSMTFMFSIFKEIGNNENNDKHEENTEASKIMPVLF